MSDADKLRKARALIEDPDRWCQGEMRDNKGRMCALGAAMDAGALHGGLELPPS